MTRITHRLEDTSFLINSKNTAAKTEQTALHATPSNCSKTSGPRAKEGISTYVRMKCTKTSQPREEGRGIKPYVTKKCIKLGSRKNMEARAL
jgi:hypothetical protein